MGSRWNRLVGGKCRHQRKLVVSSVGVRRFICHGCGHVSFKMTETVTGNKTFANETELPRVAGL